MRVGHSPQYIYYKLLMLLKQSSCENGAKVIVNKLGFEIKCSCQEMALILVMTYNILN